MAEGRSAEKLPPVRERLLGAACQILDDTSGDADYSVATLCERAEVARSAISKHFLGLDDLYVQASMHLLEAFLEDLELRSTKAGVQPGRERAKERIVELFDWFSDRPKLTSFLFEPVDFEHPMQSTPIANTVLGRLCAEDTGEISEGSSLWAFATTLALAAESVVDAPERPVDIDFYLEYCKGVLTAAFAEPYVAGQALSPRAQALSDRRSEANRAFYAALAEPGQEPSPPPRTGSGIPMSVPRRRGRPSGATETKSRLVDSAVRLLEDGLPLPSLTLTMVAKKAAHVPSALYNHYGTVDELLLAARQAWTKRLDDFEPLLDRTDHPLVRMVNRAFLLAEDARFLPEFYREMFFRQPGPPPWPFSLHTVLSTGVIVGGFFDLEELISVDDLPSGNSPENLLSGLSLFLRVLTFLIMYRPADTARLAETLGPVVSKAFQYVLFSDVQVPPHCLSSLELVNQRMQSLAKQLAADGEPNTLLKG